MDYINSNKLSISFVALSTIALFALLTGFNLEQAFFVSCIYAVFGVVFLLINFLSFNKKTRALEKTLDTVNFKYLPETSDVNELLYQEIIEGMSAKYMVLSKDVQNIKDDLKDYYGAWFTKINAPISSLKNLLKTDDLPQSCASDIAQIQKYSELVLKYLLIESITSDIVLEDCDLKAIARKSGLKLGQELLDKNIRFNMKNCDVFVKSNETWLSFVMDQILSNAIKFTKYGEITVYSRDNKIFISDTGIGILPQDLPNVFEHGFTGFNGSLTKSTLGVGLFLSKKALDKLGHEISIESSVDSGTTICITL